MKRSRKVILKFFAFNFTYIWNSLKQKWNTQFIWFVGTWQDYKIYKLSELQAYYFLIRSSSKMRRKSNETEIIFSTTFNSDVIAELPTDHKTKQLVVFLFHFLGLFCVLLFFFQKSNNQKRLFFLPLTIHLFVWQYYTVWVYCHGLLALRAGIRRDLLILEP